MLSVHYPAHACLWQWWALASLAGMALALVLDSFYCGNPSLTLRWLLAIPLGGALVGVLQQRLLRHAVARSWWWVPACAVGWAPGMIAVFLPATNAPSALFVFAMLAGLILALITGSVLVWLLRQPAQPAAAPGWARPAGAIVGTVVVLLPVLLMVLHALAYLLSPPQYRDLPMDGDGVRRVAFSPDGRLLLTAAPYDVRLWEVATGRALDVQPGVAGMVADVAFSPDGTCLAIADGATVQLWDVATGARVRTFAAIDRPYAKAGRIAFSPDGRLLAGEVLAGDLADAVWLWEVATGATRRNLPTGDWTGNLAFSPDGAVLAIDTVLFDVATGAEVRRLPFSGWTNAVVFSPDGALLATTGEFDARKVQLWDAMTGTLARTLRGHRHQIRGLAFSPDGRLLATASDDRTVKLWEVATGELLHTLEGHAWCVRGVAFSPDGATLASASFDGTVKLWDVTTGAELQSIAWPGVRGQTSYSIACVEVHKKPHSWATSLLSLRPAPRAGAGGRASAASDNE